VWLDCASAIDGAATLGKVFKLDRVENRIRDIIQREPGTEVPYLCAEFHGCSERADVEEYESAEGELIVNMLWAEGLGDSPCWDLAGHVDRLVQALEADRTRGGLVFKWWFKGADGTEDLLRPYRLARLRFGYEYAPLPGARITG
jgi:hypothetical protein